MHHRGPGWNGISICYMQCIWLYWQSFLESWNIQYSWILENACPGWLITLCKAKSFGPILLNWFSVALSWKHSDKHYLFDLKCFISLNFLCHPTFLPNTHVTHYFVSSVSAEKFHLPSEKQLKSCKMGPYYKIPHLHSHFKHTFLQRRD